MTTYETARAPSDLVIKLPPDDSFLVKVQESEHHQSMVRFANICNCTMYTSQATRQNEDFGQYLASLDPWENELIHYVQLSHHNISSVMTKITHGFIAASDGSVCHKTEGSFGWIVRMKTGKRLVWAYGPVLGAFPSSYRAGA